MTDPLVILHVTAPSRVGGLEKVVSALASGHVHAAHTVHVAAVVSAEADAGPFLAALTAQGVRTSVLVVSSRNYLRERKLVRELCTAVRPSVVHTHGYRTDVVASGVARSLGIPTVTTAHGFTFGGWRNRLYEALQVRAFRSFDGVVAVSQPLFDSLERSGVPRSRLNLIVNAWSADRPLEARVDARARLGLPDDARCVGWVGRLSHEKGADVLIDALPHLETNCIVCFVGDGPERTNLEARAAALGVADRIRWCGIVEHAGSLLRAFDVFALSSRTEGTPIVLFEAMSARLPIVATRVGGVPSVVGNGSALLVDSEDPVSLARAIDTIFDEPEEASRRADTAARELAARYPIGPWLSAYESLYRRVARR